MLRPERRGRGRRDPCVLRPHLRPLARSTTRPRVGSDPRTTGPGAVERLIMSVKVQYPLLARRLINFRGLKTSRRSSATRLLKDDRSLHNQICSSRLAQGRILVGIYGAQV
ncbi:hypothetical protein MRB53_038204 [Persea americana]|nr:hypothetical protein MRB53_038204 [Persea americana]